MTETMENMMARLDRVHQKSMPTPESRSQPLAVQILHRSAQPRQDRPAPVRFHLERHEFALLCADAERRMMEPRELAAKILETVIRDDLVNAVLDDGRAAA